MSRRRPSAALVGLAALILAIAGLVAALTHEPDEEVAISRGPVETTTSVPEPTSTSSTATTLSTTTVPIVTTTPGSSSTTLRRVPTTVVRGTTTSRPAPPTTSTTTPPCAAAQIEITADTDKPSYARTEKVRVDSTLRNRSADVCVFVAYDFTASFQDATGREINAYTRNSGGTQNTPFAPGQVIRASTTWDPLACSDPTCFAAPAGEYAVRVTWEFPGGPYSASRAFSRS